MYIKTVLSMLVSWLVGLLIDANIGYGDYCGMTSFRVLFPIISMAVCILSEIKKTRNGRN